MRSTSKAAKDLFVKPCFTPVEQDGPLFPPEIPPSDWNSCRDVYEYTWMQDKSREIVGLDPEDKIRLANSMGFCPHVRCQLYNLTQTGRDGKCPSGLCYTKVENGGLSYGACCFPDDGYFNAGKLIGVYEKTQPHPKPVYKHSRVVLGDKVGGKDESRDSFINANVVYPGLIISQCPLLPHPTGAWESTIQDTKRMILEQRITKWIQIAPFLSNTKNGNNVDVHGDGDYAVADFERALIAGSIEPGKSNPYIASTSTCGVFPLILFKENQQENEEDYEDKVDATKERSRKNIEGAETHDVKKLNMHGVKNFQIHRHMKRDRNMKSDDIHERDQLRYVNMSYTISGCVKTLPNGARIGKVGVGNSRGCEDEAETENEGGNRKVGDDDFDMKSNVSAWKYESFTVNHIWYFSWKDFETPPISDDSAIRRIARETADAMKNGETTVISCVAGRGRSGTFAAIVVGFLKKVSNLKQLVQVIVNMRENRDGLVETPQHFRFVARVLGLPDPSVIPSYSQSPPLYPLSPTISISTQFRVRVKDMDIQTSHPMVLFLLVAVSLLIGYKMGSRRSRGKGRDKVHDA